jgi:hypothetical protein
LAVLAVGLIVLHIALDAGSGREAPGWIIYGAIFSGAAGAVVGSLGRR